MLLDYLCNKFAVLDYRAQADEAAAAIGEKTAEETALTLQELLDEQLVMAKATMTMLQTLEGELHHERTRFIDVMAEAAAREKRLEDGLIRVTAWANRDELRRRAVMWAVMRDEERQGETVELETQHDAQVCTHLHPARYAGALVCG